MPVPDFEVESMISYEEQKTSTKKQLVIVSKPDPDSEIESLVDFRSEDYHSSS